MNQDQQPQRWWKNNWPILALISLMVVIATITGLGYWQRLAWTGLVYIPEHPKTRMVWDWLDLLIIPIVLGLGAFWFNNQTRKSERTLDEDRASREALQQYLDRMQELIFDKDLKESWREDSDVRREVRHVARARTLTVLRGLNGIQKGQMVMFLHEAGLIRNVREKLEEPEAIINLTDADLNRTDLSDIVTANLSGAILRRACLKDAKLSNADLSDAILSSAILEGAKLSSVNQNVEFTAKLIRADLRGANLKGAKLSGVCLEGAKLSGVNQKNGKTTRTDLSGAILSEADLTSADLRDANLSHAKGCTDKQLAQAKSLVGAIMPDGTVMTEEEWGEFKRRYGQ